MRWWAEPNYWGGEKTGASSEKRLGFQQLVAQVSLGQVGAVFGYEVSRLARNNRDWYHLLDLCSIFGTLIADNDGIYNPSDYNDRLLLGLKGTISEAELHVMRGRMNAGLWNKARKGQLIVNLPMGYRLTPEGLVLKDPDESVQKTLMLIFDKFVELESASKVFLWFVDNDLQIPGFRRKFKANAENAWVRPVYSSIYKILRNPFYAGAYFYGRTRTKLRPSPDGRLQAKSRQLPMNEWEVLIQDHHESYVSWDQFTKNQDILRANRIMGEMDERSRPGRGTCLLQGIVRCGRCGRMMRVEYSGASGKVARYICRVGHDSAGANHCQSTGGGRIDDAVATEFLRAVEPARLAAISEALELLRHEKEQLRSHWNLQIERAAYEADRSRRQYYAVEPENRLVARDLERRWNEKLQVLEEIREQAQQHSITDQHLEEAEKMHLLAVGQDMSRVWNASTTSIEDQKQLLRTLVDEVVLVIDRQTHSATVSVIWHGGMRTSLEVALNKTGHHRNCAATETIELVRQMASYLPDRAIAIALNRQGLRTGKGNQFTQERVRTLRVTQDIPPYIASADAVPAYNIAEAAKKLAVSTTTVHRWLKAGLLNGIQLSPSAPWLIQISNEEVDRLKAQGDQIGHSLSDLAAILGKPKGIILSQIQAGEIKARRVQGGRRSRWILDSGATRAPGEDPQFTFEYD
jgi:DNA invertase Pin-like site-specific DNA recombinase